MEFASGKMFTLRFTSPTSDHFVAFMSSKNYYRSWELVWVNEEYQLKPCMSIFNTIQWSEVVTEFADCWVVELLVILRKSSKTETHNITAQKCTVLVRKNVKLVTFYGMCDHPCCDNNLTQKTIIDKVILTWKRRGQLTMILTSFVSQAAVLTKYPRTSENNGIKYHKHGCGNQVSVCGKY